MPLAIGSRVGSYEIVAPLGQGGMGEVYRARDPRLDREVALKVLPAGALADNATRSGLLREARLAASLNHPNICTIYEAGESGEQLYIAMELIDGRQLNELVPPGGLPIETVGRFGAQIAGAAGHAHDRGIVHRDLKSTNVMVTADGRAKVLDFGIATRLRSHQLAETTRSIRPVEEGATIAGTLPYLAPEVLSGAAADTRSDVWSLGIVLWEMTTGRRPFAGHTGFELTSAILRDPLPPLPDKVPAGFARLIARCLAKEPGERFQRASEVHAALQAVDFAHTGPATQARPRSARRHALLVGAVTSVVALIAGGIWSGWFPWRIAPVTHESVAVLPLENVSKDPDQEYFADGMTDALITELGRVGSLQVTSRTSVMRYRGDRRSLRSIAGDLGVETILEGSVLRAGNQVRVTVHLIEAAADRTLWTGSYEGDVSDILTLQGNVARAIATEMRGRLTPQEAARFAHTERVAPSVHEAYLRGRYLWNRRTEESLRKAIDFFRRAIDADPAYAPAYAGLADCYLMLESQAIGALPAREALPLATSAARRALALDPELAEAHTSLARALADGWQLEEAEAEYREAIRINSNYSTAHFWFALTLSARQRMTEALNEVGRAYRLDPVSPIIAAGVSLVSHFARQDDRAVEFAARALELDPNFAIGHLRLGVAYLHEARAQDGVAALERAVATSGRSPDMLGQLGRAYALAGRVSDAQRVLADLAEMRRSRYASAFNDVLIHTGLGRMDQAFKALGEAVEERYQYLIFLRMEPDLDPLRADPRFEAVVKRTGIAF